MHAYFSRTAIYAHDQAVTAAQRVQLLNARNARCALFTFLGETTGEVDAGWEAYEQDKRTVIDSDYYDDCLYE